MGDYGERKSGITQIGAAEKRIDFIYSAVFGIRLIGLGISKAIAL